MIAPLPPAYPRGLPPRRGVSRCYILPLLLAAACEDEELVLQPPSAEAATGGGRGAAGPGPAAPPDLPPLRGAVGLGDAELAREALGLLGSPAVGAEGSCQGCHSLGRPTLSRWAQLTDSFAAECLDGAAPPGVDAASALLACFREHAEPARSWSAASFGIYSAAAHLPWFEFVFTHAATEPERGLAEHAAFVSRAGMPRAGTPLVQAEFDVVAEWFARGLPHLFELVPEDSGEDCAPSLDPRLGEHVVALAESGWRARNEQVPLLMYGCAEGEAGSACLTEHPRESSWEQPGAGSVRLLHDNGAAPSTFWARASADGRFIAYGLLDPDEGGAAGRFLDLQSGEAIAGDFAYDPTFFPDNSGFLVQRGGGSSSASPGRASNGAPDLGDVAVLCNQSVLSGEPSRVTGDESECIQLESQIGLYQQLARSIDGDDYWVVYGSYGNDNGGLAPTLDNPPAAFSSDSVTTLTPMLNTGVSFEPGAATQITTPLQGDPMLSPSGRLLVTRVKGPEAVMEVDGRELVTAEQSGYALHLVSMTRAGDAWSASLSEVGRICEQGGKAVVSYDERWMVFHRYVTERDAERIGFDSADAPGFSEYRELGASNLYLVDLLDGSSRPITRMGPGEYALFPHFRSDGWIYFVVRGLDGSEYFAASDAALRLEAGE